MFWCDRLATRISDLYPTVAMMCRSLEALDALLTEVPAAMLSTTTYTSLVRIGHWLALSSSLSTDDPLVHCVPQIASLHSHIIAEYWKPVALRLLAHQCLMYDVDVPPGLLNEGRAATDSVEVTASSASVPFTEGDEPAMLGGLSNAGRHP